jgi:CubicO group peptidase (beta-lactamase class C family)
MLLLLTAALWRGRSHFMKMQICLLAALLSCPHWVIASSSGQFEQQISDILDSEQLAGIVWSTVSEGNTKLGSAGYSNISQASEMSTSQKVQVGSVTKTVLAMGVLKLVTEGALSLDTNVEALLPQLSFRNPWRGASPVTVKSLLDHTAGLDNFRMWQFLNTVPTADTPLEDAFPPSHSNLLKIRTEPGTQYSYSNMGYAILGLVIERATGERYETYLDEYFLQPLGMADSTFHYVTQTGASADSALAMGYFEDNVEQAALPTYLRPAGQFTTTAADMSKLMHFILNDGMLDGNSVISVELMRRLGYPHKTDAYAVGLKVGHGLALAVRDRHSVVGMCHPGNTLGYWAYLCIFPEDRKAYFYAINTDSETADYEQFNALFIQALSISEVPIEQARPDVIDAKKLEGVYLPSPNNVAEFEWLDLVFNFRWLTLEDSQLVMKSLQSSDRILVPVGQSLLRATDRRTASHGIIFDEQGDIFISDGLSTFKRQPAFIVLGYWVSLLLGAVGFLTICSVGIARLLTRKTQRLNVIAWPIINLFAFSIPVFLFYKQPFLQFGEMSLASISLATISGLLPCTLLLSILLGLNRRCAWSSRDALASGMLLQLCVVLFWWDLLPIVFWR